MVGLNDIPCVGTALNQISEATVEAAKRECSYLLCYKRNVTTLEEKFKELGIQQELMNTRIVRDSNNTKIIMTHVVEGQKEVNELNSQVHEFKKRYQDRPYWFKCFRSRSFPNLYSRFKLGREAVKKTETVTALTNRTKEYLAGEISHLRRNENIPKSSFEYMDFRSRKNAYNKLLEALNNEDGPTILGIYGMPGVGKTRMMEEALKQSKDNGIFDNVVRADVSQAMDVQKLQGQLATYINLDLPPDDEEQRAFLLESRLGEGTKFLVILDDVWGKVPLNDIGIPLNDVSNKGCKILLTSRTQEACEDNNCKEVIKIGILEQDEAWELFKEIVGASITDSLVDEILARKVFKQCGGLPLVIVAVGNALRNKPELLWDDALTQLENSNLENINGIDTQMYACLKMSFDHLHKDAKSCLLFSSLFVEDAEIQFEELFELVRGSELFKGYATMEDARIRVGSMVLKLKSSSLLLEGRYNDTVKLHDIVRDVARSIAATDQDYAFLSKSCDSVWPDEDICKGRKLIDLRFKNNSVLFLDDQDFPDLRILRLECGNSLPRPLDKFFKGFPNLNVLLLTLSSLKLSDLSLIGLLKKLEILSLHSIFIEDDKPLDLRGLNRLKMLHLKFYYNDIAMPPHALLSSPSSLEELHIPRGFRILRDKAARELCPVSRELNTLTSLTNLAIYLDDAKSCPDENICKKLLRFTISVGLACRYLEHSSVKRSLKFSNGNLEGGVKTLVERAEEVFLQKVTGLQNIFTNTDREAFLHLTILLVQDCGDVEHYLARIPHRQLHKPSSSFSKLSVLEIRDSGFKYLFCASFARCLVQLKELFIYNCEEMEEIVRNEESHTDKKIDVKFPNLTSMKLIYLPKLTSFYCNQRNGVPVQKSLFNEMVTFPVLKKLEIFHLDKVQYIFNEKVVFPNLEILDIISLRKLSEIWEKQCYTDDSFCQLKMLKVEWCPELETGIPVTMRQQLQYLKELNVLDCNLKISKVEGPSECRDVEHLLVRIPDRQLHQPLRSFSKLSVLVIKHLGFKSLFCASFARCLVQLQKLKIVDCEVEEIVRNEESHIDKEIEFPNLRSMMLDSLPKLRSFYCNKRNGGVPVQQSIFNEMVVFPNLEKLEIDSLEKVGEIWEKQCYIDDSFCQLKTLKMMECPKLETVIPLTMRQQLQHLKEPIVLRCNSSVNSKVEGPSA